jgi:hypothetical protein
VLKFNPVPTLVEGSSESFVVGLEPHRDPFGEAARIPPAVKVNKDAGQNKKECHKESRNDGRNLEKDISM